MADNTAISAKKKMHMLLNERDRLSAYRCRIQGVETDKNSFYECNRYGKRRNKDIRSHCNTDMRRKRLLCYGGYRR